MDEFNEHSREVEKGKLITQVLNLINNYEGDNFELTDKDKLSVLAKIVYKELDT